MSFQTQVFSNENIIIAVDFGTKNDVAIETTGIIKNGVLFIKESKVIGKAKDFIKEEKRNAHIQWIKNRLEAVTINNLTN